ncbi:heparan-alpha-glucosaminide N-acetyltransferase-like isoform X2 [Branchiostoma floridae]|uniref:Heparan-alpha-glucosaminide N-acetyltransferase-like isoform X2 n=1 Tax=Branchiostoma floridae TaxID=7739 RepID=A0A9J7KQR3_BRAFL|nr:heparan-alpha-glucosaminide N-acetyltransferase-like isoform X2 [Branchiostoma floridae]
MAAVSVKTVGKLLFFFTFFSTVKAIDSPTDKEILQYQLQRDSRHHHHMGEVPRMTMDTAILKVNTSLDYAVQIWAVSAECHKCNMSFMMEVDPSIPTEPFLVQTTFMTHISIVKDNHDGTNDSICSLDKLFGEHGEYQMFINANGPSEENKFDCPVYPDKDPIDSNIPILVAFCIYVGLVLLFLAVRQLYYTIGRSQYAWFIGYFPFRETDRLVNSDLGAPSPSSTATEDRSQTVANSSTQPASQGIRRLRSLDTFRGLSLAVMVFVNYGGGGYWFFKHARWNGLTVADLVFPWFVFIMGTSIALSFRRLLKKGVSRLSLLLKVIQRTVILFLFGLFIINTKKGHNSWSTLRIPGVLQRLALTYFIVALMEVIGATAEDRNWSWKHRGYLSLYLLQTSRIAPIRDIVNSWGQWLFMIVVVTLHLVLMFWLQVPNCPIGYLGPGGLSDIAHYNCTGGATGYIDRAVFTDDHIYQHPTPITVYKTEVPFEPEGLLGTLTSALLCFLGLQAGKILLTYPQNGARVGRWLGWAVATGAIGGLLCNGRQNEGWIPLNKNLWSLSFVLVLSCFAFVLLSVCYIIVDVKQWWTGAPFYQVGMNSILVYIGHELCADKLPFQWAASPTHASQLATDLVGTTLWVLIAVWLHYKKFYLKI